MYNQEAQNAGVVSGNVQQVLLALRAAAHDALYVLQWVTDQTHADLVAIGFQDGDAVALQQVAGDMVTLLSMMAGGPPAPQKDYLAEARPLLGPNR